jgi:hypothetical protein
MLDSLVRVSRRVGGAADLLAPETRAVPARTLAIRAHPHTRRLRSQARGAPGTSQELHPRPRSRTSGSAREGPEKCCRRGGRRPRFPSRYLFAIGLGVIFSLTRSLPRALSCTPKQLDSREEVSAAPQPPYGPITLFGPWPQSRWTWTGRSTARRLSQTPHSTRPRGPAVRCWALPVSFAITKGITVVFFSSAH